MRRECKRIIAPGVLEPPVQSGTKFRWLCQCGANGNWLETERLRARTAELRLRDQYAAHVERTKRAAR